MRNGRKLTKYSEHVKTWSHKKSKKKYAQSVKGKIAKSKDDIKYYAKKKQDPEFMKKKKERDRKYGKTDQHKLNMKKYRSNPKVQKQNAKYNKKWAEDNPDLVIQNNQRYMKKLAGKTDLTWTMFMSQLKGWAKIIQTDCNEECQICGEKSTQAHHIIHKSLYPQLSFNRNNGIALCDDCHYEVHGKLLI
jgi:5-methylcytosine-specific restriction endonuclease McrA